MSTSLGRLTLELAADPTQLNSDLTALKSQVQQVAKDIEQSFNNAFGNVKIPDPPKPPSIPNIPPIPDPWKDVKEGLKNLQRDLSSFFSGLKSFNFSTITTSFQKVVSNIPSIAKEAFATLPGIFADIGLKAAKSFGDSITSVVKSAFSSLTESSKELQGKLTEGLKPAIDAVSFGFFAEAGAKAFEKVTGVIEGSIERVKEFGKEIFGVLKEVQTYQARLTTFIRDDDKRKELSDKLNAFSATTPFELHDIRDSAISSMATMADPSKVKIDQFMGDLKTLGDIAAGSQIKIQDLAEKFASARAAGIAHNDDLASWAGRGIPIYQELGKLIGANMNEVKAMAADGKINFELLNTALHNMTKEGGHYFNAMKDQAETLTGKMSNIADIAYQFKEKLGKAFEPLANLGIDIFGKVIEGLSHSQSLMDGINAQTKELADYFKQNPALIDALSKSVQSLVEGSMQALISGVKMVVDFFKEYPNLINQSAEAVNGVVSIFGDLIKYAVDFVSTIGGALFEGLTNNVNILEGFKSILETVSKLWEDNKQLIIDTAEIVGRALGEALGAVIGLIQDAYNWLGQNKEILNVIIEVIGAIGVGFAEVIKFAVNLAQVIGEAVWHALNSNNDILNVIKQIVAVIGEIWIQHRQELLNIGKVLGELIGQAIKVIVDLVLQILNYLKQHPAIIGTITTGFIAAGKALEIAIGWLQKGLQALGGLIDLTSKWLSKLAIVQKALSWIQNLAGSGGGEEQEQGNNSGGSAAGGLGKKADDFVGAVLSILESPTRQGRVDVAQVIANRVGENFDGHGKTIRDQAFASGQFQPFFKETYGITKDEIQDEESAIRALRKAHFSASEAKKVLQEFFTDISDASKVADSQSKVGGRAYFKGVSQYGAMEKGDFLRQDQENFFHHMAGDTKNRNVTEIGKVFGTGGGRKLGNFDESGVGGGSSISNPGGGYTVLDSTTGASVSNYSQLSVHHQNSRGGGTGREADRDYVASSTHQGLLEEARVGDNIVGGAHIKKDFVMEDKNGSLDVGTPAPTSGKVIAIYPEVGAVVIGDDQGRRKGAALHMKNIRVKVGDPVQYGQIIGTQSGVSGYPVHSHVELPEAEFSKYIQDIKSGRFASSVRSKHKVNKSLGSFDESDVGSDSSSSALSNIGGGSATVPSTSSTTPSSSNSKASTSTSSSSTSDSTSSSSENTLATANAKRALLITRQKEAEKQYKTIASEIEFTERNQKAEIKQSRELEDKKREDEERTSTAELKLKIASSESEEAKKIYQRELKKKEIDTKYDKEDIKLQRELEDLQLAQKNKINVQKEAEKRKQEFIAAKKKAGEDYTEADLKKFDVLPDEKNLTNYAKSIAAVKQLIESRKKLRELDYETEGVSESTEDKKARLAKERERAIAEVKRKGAEDQDKLKLLISATIDPDTKKKLEEKLKQDDIKLKATLELMPVDNKLEDLQKAMSEVLNAGVKKDAPEVKELQKQIDELNKQKAEIVRKSGVDAATLENERKQATTVRDRENEAQEQKIATQTKIAEIDKKLITTRSDAEKASLTFEKQKLELIQQQSDEQKPLLDKLADLNKDRTNLLAGGIKESSDEMKVLDRNIADVNAQLAAIQAKGINSMTTLTKESAKAIEAAKIADEKRLTEKDQLLSNSDVNSARLEQMKSRGNDPYAISGFEKEIQLSQEALRYRQAMADVEEKIASLRNTNAELSATEEQQLRNNARAIHEMNVDKVNDNVRTLGKDLSNIGKGAVKDFFGQLVSGSMDFNSIMKSIISQIGNLAVELIQSQLFGEGGIFGKKKKKADDSGGGFLSGLLDGSKTPESFLGGMGGAGSTPMQPAYVTMVGGASGLGGLFGNTGSMGGDTDYISSLFGGSNGFLGFNAANPLPINMISASKDAFSGLGDIFSSLLGGLGGGGGGLGSLLGGLLGSGGSGGFGGGFLSFIPNLLGFAEGGKVQGLNINQLPIDNHPISKALRAENMASGKKPILAVLHEGELVLNREQQERAGIFDIPRFDNGGMVGGGTTNFNKKNETTINMSFNGGDSDTNGLDANALRAVINQEIIRQQGSGGSLGRGSYSRRGR